MKEGNITTDPMNREKIINIYYEQLYVHRFHNLDEMDQFLERYNLQNLQKNK